MNEWLLIFGMMILTFGPRYLPMALAGKFRIPLLLQRALEFVPIAILTAIIAKTSLVHDGKLDLSFSNHYLYGVAAAILTAWLTKHTFITILVGLFVYVITFATI